LLFLTCVIPAGLKQCQCLTPAKISNSRLEKSTRWTAKAIPSSLALNSPLQNGKRKLEKMTLKLENYEKIARILDAKSRRSAPKVVNDLPWRLRGYSNNKYGGHQSQRMRAFKGSKCGPASAVRQYSPEECANWVKEWQARTKKEGGLRQAG
jgi:hypothetical protein